MTEKQMLERIAERVEQLTTEGQAMALGLALGLSASQKITAEEKR